MKESHRFVLLIVVLMLLNVSGFHASVIDHQAKSLQDVSPVAYKDVDRIMAEMEKMLTLDLEQKRIQVQDMLLFNPSDRIMDDLDIKLSILKDRVLNRLRSDLESKIIHFSWSRMSKEVLTEEEKERFTQTMMLTWESSIEMEFDQFKRDVIPQWLQVASRFLAGKEERITRNVERVIQEAHQENGMAVDALNTNDDAPVVKKRFLGAIADAFATLLGLGLAAIIVGPAVIVGLIVLSPLWIPAGIIFLIVYAFTRIVDPY